MRRRGAGFGVMLMAAGLLGMAAISPCHAAVSVTGRYAQTFPCPDGQYAVLMDQGQFDCPGVSIAAVKAVLWLAPEKAAGGKTVVTGCFRFADAANRAGAKIDGARLEDFRTRNLDDRTVMLSFTARDEILLTAELTVQRPGMDQPFYREMLTWKQRNFMPPPPPPVKVVRPVVPVASVPVEPEVTTTEVTSETDALTETLAPAMPGQSSATVESVEPTEPVSPEQSVTRSDPTVELGELAAEDTAIETPVDDEEQLESELMITAEPVVTAMPEPQVPSAAVVIDGDVPVPPTETVERVVVPPSMTSAVYIQPTGTLISQPLDDQTDAMIYSGGIYVAVRLPESQRAVMEERGLLTGQVGDETLLEFRADNAVVFYRQDAVLGDAPDASPVGGIYFQGHVSIQAADHRLRADQAYYDPQADEGVMTDAVLGVMVPEREVPFYVRAEAIYRHDRTHFSARKARFSTDAFYEPHVSLDVDDMAIDTAGDDPNTAASFTMKGITGQVGGVPLMYWPSVSADSANATVPVKRVRGSFDGSMGTSLETEWNLPWLANGKLPAGVDGTFRVDGYSKRGPAVGADIDYQRDRAYGSVTGYLVHDDGTDDLGDIDSRKDLEPERPLRGRLKLQHRQFLADSWQATVEMSYISDSTFMEGWFPKEFYTGKEQETVVHLKRQKGNKAFELLGKWHLNDDEYTMTELPSAGYYWVGQDLFEKLTWNQETRAYRLGERAGRPDVASFGDDPAPSILPDVIDRGDTTLAVSRHEVSLPLMFGAMHLVPTVIGTAAYDDTFDRPEALQGTAGVRAAMTFWKVDRSVESRLWDLHGIRHVVTPEIHAFVSDDDSDWMESRNLLHLAINQRWQTMRGIEGNRHSVDWLRWDNSVTLVNHDVDDQPWPNHYRTGQPEAVIAPRTMLNGDLANIGMARRKILAPVASDFAESRLEWNLSDTTIVTGGGNFNLHDGVLAQADLGTAWQRGDRSSVYLGDHYLRDADTWDNDDSHFLTAAASYKLNRKYTVAVSYQYDITKTRGSYTELVLLRRFPRWFGAFNIAYDADNGRMMFGVSFWPEGFEDVTMGSRRFNHLAE